MSCLTVTDFQTSDLMYGICIYCFCEQTAKVESSHYKYSINHHKLIRNFNQFQPYKFYKFTDRLDTCIVTKCYTEYRNNLMYHLVTHIIVKAQGIYLNEYLR